jgi:hypothetical protein
VPSVMWLPVSNAADSSDKAATAEKMEESKIEKATEHALFVLYSAVFHSGSSSQVMILCPLLLHGVSQLAPLLSTLF